MNTQAASRKQEAASKKPVAVVGAAGRMGRRIVSLLAADETLAVGIAVEATGCQQVGRDAGELAGVGNIGVPVQGGFEGNFEAVIDFSHPAALAATVENARKRQVPLVVGTTGMGPEHHALIEQAAGEIPLIWAPNFSVGVNLLLKLAEQVAWALGDDYDAEIIELHHRFKKDAPSGTALALAKAIARAREVRFEDVAVYGRKGQVGERRRDELGVHAARAGDIVGDHTVLFSSLGERIELVHRAHTRDAFAAGALRALKFLLDDKPPGRYNMQQVLGF